MSAQGDTQDRIPPQFLLAVATGTAPLDVAHLSVAASRRLPRGDDTEERTKWHRLTFWDRLAEIVEDHVRKGERLFVEGHPEYGSFQRDDTTIPTAESVVRDLVLLGGPRRQNGLAPDEREDLP